MTSHRDSHTITDVKPEMIPGVQTGNGIPHDKYNIRGILYSVFCIINFNTIHIVLRLSNNNVNL